MCVRYSQVRRNGKTHTHSMALYRYKVCARMCGCPAQRRAPGIAELGVVCSGRQRHRSVVALPVGVATAAAAAAGSLVPHRRNAGATFNQRRNSAGGSGEGWWWYKFPCPLCGIPSRSLLLHAIDCNYGRHKYWCQQHVCTCVCMPHVDVPGCYYVWQRERERCLGHVQCD